MKIFICQDTDGGRQYYVLARDMKTAIDIFIERCQVVPPEIVRDITADVELLIMKSEAEKIWLFVDDWLIGNTSIDPDKLLDLKKELDKEF